MRITGKAPEARDSMIEDTSIPEFSRCPECGSIEMLVTAEGVTRCKDCNYSQSFGEADEKLSKQITVSLGEILKGLDDCDPDFVNHFILVMARFNDLTNLSLGWEEKLLQCLMKAVPGWDKKTILKGEEKDVPEMFLLYVRMMGELRETLQYLKKISGTLAIPGEEYRRSIEMPVK